MPAGGRAIVLTPSAGRKPFEVYLPDAALLNAPVVVVSEVVLIDVRGSHGEAFAERALPRGSPRGSYRHSSPRSAGGAPAPTS